MAFDNAKYFSSLNIVEFALKCNINLKYSANYYPQGNGVIEYTNKNLLWITKKTVVENQRDWHTALDTALWADRVTPRISLGTSPYFLVYGKESIFTPKHLFTVTPACSIFSWSIFQFPPNLNQYSFKIKGGKKQS